MEKQVYKCECGYTTHFEKALTAHCKFRHHHPAKDKVEDETIVADIEKEVKKAVKREMKKKDDTAETTVTKKATTRKPRTKKTDAEKE